MADQHHLQNIINSAIDFAVIATDLSGIVTDWNTGAENVFGWSAGEMTGSSAERIFTPEDKVSSRMQVEMLESRENGRASDERWHVRQDGSRFWASGEMMPLRDEDGTHHGFVKIVRDRTTHQLASERLQVSENRFRTLLDSVDSAFAIVEVKFDDNDRALDYRFIEANPAFEREAGVNLQGRWVTEFAPNLERFWFDIYGHVALTGEPARFENFAEAFNRWFEVRATRIGDPSERRISIVFNDVTERRNAAERLRVVEEVSRQNAERMQLALNAGAILGTWVWEMPVDRFTVDDGFAYTFGIDPMLAKNGLSLEQVVETVHPADKEGLKAAIKDAIDERSAYSHQYRVRLANGIYRWIEASGHVHYGDDGSSFTFPGVLLDVHDRRAMDEERELNAAALSALNETLEQRVADRTTELMRAEEHLRQAQKMEAVGQLTGGLAHDFNNLLAAISGALQLMDKRVEQGRFTDFGRYVEIARGATQRAAALTHRLLAFSRRQTLDPKPTDSGILVAGIEDLIRRTVGPQIETTVVLGTELRPVLVDPHQLENSVLNLCINARDAMPDGGTLSIETANQTISAATAPAWNIPAGEYVVVRVTDTGSGMSPEIVERVFEPFFTTKPLGMGTGLGLSMVYGFATQSGGVVRIHSKVGMGTAVSIYLPRHDVLPEAEKVAVPLTAPKALRGETVVVVEDEPAISALITEVLQELGYMVLSASDGASALTLLRSKARVDLLITDVGLPGGINGRQVADAARVDRPDLPILFVTGYAEGALGDQLPSGMYLITKPFGMDILALRARELIES